MIIISITIKSKLEPISNRKMTDYFPSNDSFNFGVDFNISLLTVGFT